MANLFWKVSKRRYSFDSIFMLLILKISIGIDDIADSIHIGNADLSILFDKFIDVIGVLPTLHLLE